MTEWIGQRLGGYLLEEELGRNTLGILFRGKQLALGREVAVEVLPRHLPHDPAALARFLRQARIMAQLNHPNILQIYDAGQHDDLVYLVMEYVQGLSIRNFLNLDGRLPQQLAAAYAAQVADALEAAYQECRVIHRNITPEHVVLDWRGRLKVTGFGLARAQSLPPITTGAHPVESLAYASPEQLWGQPLDYRSDIYALGIVLYEMVTGTHPFAGHTLRELAQAITSGRLILPTKVVPGVALELEYIILTALATNPDERFAHAGIMADALRAFLFHTRSIGPASHTQGAAISAEGDPSTPQVTRHLTLPMRPSRQPLSSDPDLSEEDTAKVMRHLTLPMRPTHQPPSSDPDLSEEDTAKRMVPQPRAFGWQVGQQVNSEQSA